MTSNKDNNNDSRGFKPSNPNDIIFARRGKKHLIDFPVSPLLKKVHPATPALTLCLPLFHDQAIAPAPNTTTNEYEEEEMKETGNNSIKGHCRVKLTCPIKVLTQLVFPIVGKQSDTW